MRAHSSRRAHTRAATALFAGFLMAAFGACADAVHLAPPGADAGTTSATTGGGSGCKSNPDCAYPTAVCDTVSGKCVECLVLSDCAGKPGTVCSKGACECPSPDGAGSLTYCAAEAPTCVNTETSVTSCGKCGHACPSGDTCVKGACKGSSTSTGTGGGSGAGGAGGAGGAASAPGTGRAASPSTAATGTGGL